MVAVKAPRAVQLTVCFLWWKTVSSLVFHRQRSCDVRWETRVVQIHHGPALAVAFVEPTPQALASADAGSKTGWAVSQRRGLCLKFSEGEPLSTDPADRHPTRHDTLAWVRVHTHACEMQTHAAQFCCPQFDVPFSSRIHRMPMCTKT